MTAVFPGGAPNTFVPSLEASGKLCVDFSRSPDSFSVNEYCQILPVKKSVGIYTKMTVENAGRLIASEWADGDDAPSGRGNTESFDFPSFRTQRHAFPFRIGHLAADQADWNLLAQLGRMAAQQAMTKRTQKAITLLTATGSYPSSSHYSAAASTAGSSGKWDESTTARSDIKRCLDYARDFIRLQTLGAVQAEDFRLVISPTCARKMSLSQEIVDYIKGSPDAKDWIRGNFGSKKPAMYGLPEYLYGMKIVIEDAVKTTSKKGATKAVSDVLTSTTALVLSRPGGLVAPEGSEMAARFSTATIFMQEEMTVEQKHDTDNRVHKGRVVENYSADMTAGIAGYMFTSVVN